MGNRRSWPHTRTLAVFGAATIGLGLSLWQPLETYAAEECREWQDMSDGFDAELRCQAKQELGDELTCVGARLAHMPPWRCRDDAARQWAADSAGQAFAAAVATADDPVWGGGEASEQMFAAVLTMLIGLEGTADAAEGVCATARKSLDYGCNRAECPAPDSADANLSPLYADARERYDDACEVAFERQCDAPSDAPPNCKEVEQGRTNYAKALRLYRGFEANENPAMRGDADYIAQRDLWRAKLAELAVAIESAARSPEANDEVAALLDAHHAEVALPSIASAAQAASRLYGTYAEAGVPGYAGKISSLERLVSGLPDCSKGCANLSGKLDNAGKAYARVVAPDRTNDWMIKVQGELVPGKVFLSRQ